jgi:predicted metal-dependent phosphoesterase TrpH/predicted ATPase
MNKDINNTRGSEWRKWDLHFHTPSSYDYKDKSVSNELIIETLSQNGISVVAITDHHIIDIARIKELQQLGKEKNITILSGIEFLSDARGDVPIHFIGLFSENCNLEYVWGQIENITNISKIKGEQKEINQVYCHLSNTIKLIKELGGITTIHAGCKTNTIENITHSLPHSEAQKTDIAHIIDFYELGKADDKTGYIDKVFPSINKHIPMIICSDNHDIKHYVLKENCWIKADCTFEGLKQVIYEPTQRVRIQELKPQEKAAYQVIDSVTISHSDFFPQTIYFNQNLNAIIGGRSTGKSVLLGAIATKLNCDNEVKWGNKEYTDFVNAVASGLKVTWKDGVENNDRNIEYYPQSHMYRLAKNGNKELDKIVESIIEQDSSKHILISNYATFSSNNNTEIINKINKLFQIKNDGTTKSKLSKEKGDEAGIINEIKKLETELLELKKKIQITEDELKQYNDLKSKLDNLIKENENIDNQIAKIQSLKSKFFISEEISYELVVFNDSNKSKVKTAFEELKSRFQNEWENKIDEISNQNNDVKKQNNEQIAQVQKNQLYIKGIETVKNNKQYIEIEDKLKIQKGKLSDILQIKKEIDDLRLQYQSCLTSIIQSNRDYLNKINEIKDSLNISRDKLEIKAEATIKLTDYKGLLNSSINLQSYQGQEIVYENISTFEDFFKSINNLFRKLLNNEVTLKGGYKAIELAKEILSANFFEITYKISYDTDTFQTMSEGKKAFVVLMLLLDFSNKDCPILIDQPEDDLDNRSIYKNLVKYLSKKKKERQIILVTHNPNIVVGADSELIIVANQNGTGTPNSHSSKFQYISGSLENTKPFDDKIKTVLDSKGIREHVCEILEGGSEAFENREKKYGFKK